MAETSPLTTCCHGNRTGVGELDDLSSEDEDVSPSSCGMADATTPQEEEPKHSDRYNQSSIITGGRSKVMSKDSMYVCFRATTSQTFSRDKLSDSHCRSPPQVRATPNHQSSASS